ncbi:Uncharacterised protein [Chlamydia trachomatis]|nr:Uncharacterised protein [Chlamydia trachomatis]
MSPVGVVAKIGVSLTGKLIKERQRITFKEFAKSFLYLLLTPPKIGYFNNANNNLIGNVTRSNNALKEIMIVCLFWLL